MGRQKKFVRVFSLTFWALSISVCHLALATVASSDSRHCSRDKCLICSGDKCVIENRSNAQVHALPTPNKAMRQFPTYSPVVDVAQYALHQGDSRSANLIEGFIPLYQSGSNTLSFADIRFYNPNGTPVEGNIDLGFRRLFHQSKNLFGLYAGYDRYRSETRRYYSQINAGLELWFNRFFIGGNGYLPVGTKVYDNDAVNLAYLVSTNTSYRYNIAYEQGKERAMPGGDAEIGYDITPHFTLYGGGYYFDHADAKSIAGPKLRATYTFYRAHTHPLLKLFDRIRLEGLISHDSVRGTSWMAGLRFRFGLSKHPNPTAGVARHMTDPIRRDLNVVSENFNLLSELYKIDNRPARVDLVGGASSRSIDEAVDGSDANADIIGVIGNQPAQLDLSLGLREMTITGGNFEFSVGDHPYTVYNLGQQGSVTAAANNPVFNLVPDSEIVTLEHLGLFTNSADTDQFALTNDNAGNFGSFAHLTIDDVETNAPIVFKLNTTDAIGQLTFINNYIHMIDSDAFDSDAGQGETGIVGLGLFVQSSANQIIVSSFKNNRFEVTNNLKDHNFFLLDAESTGQNPVLFSGGIKNNTIVVRNNFGSIDPGNCTEGFFNKNIVINGDFIRNSISATGYAGTGSGDETGTIAIHTAGDLIIVDSFSNNTLIVSNLGGRGTGWVENTANVTFIINGDFSYNTVKSTHNLDRGLGMLTNYSPIIINGNMFNNNFITTNNGQFSANIRSGGANIRGNVYNNHFLLSNNNANTAAFFFPSAVRTISIQGNVENNEFIFSGNSGSERAFLIDGIFEMKGRVTNNIIQSTNNTGDNTNSRIGFFLKADNSNITFDKAIANNTFIFDTGDTNDYGFYMEVTKPYSINLKGNLSPTELSKSNNDTTVYPSVPTDGINYGQ